MPASAPPQFRVLVVDWENRGRSAALERILRHYLARKAIPEAAVHVESAGLRAIDGQTMQPEAHTEILRQGADPGGFLTRALTPALVDGADVIVTGIQDQLDALLAVYPHVARRAFTMAHIGELYGEEVVLAPLHEHPAILARLRERANLQGNDALPALDGTEASRRAWGDAIADASQWIADLWGSAWPGRAPLAPDAADREVLRLDAFGVRVDVVCRGTDGAALAAAARNIWGRCAAPEGTPAEVTVAVAVDPDRDARAAAREAGALAYGDVAHALHFLTSTVTVRAIGAREGGPVLLHAAGLAAPTGEVAGFIAPSGTGKTTLATTLGRAYGYVTDETLAIAPDRTVTAYPKPLSVIEGPVSGIKVQRSPESLGLLPAPGELRLVRLILIERDPSLDSPVLEEVDLLEGLAELAEQVSYLARLPHRLHTLADLVESVGGLSRLRYPEAADVLPLMPTLLGGAS